MPGGRRDSEELPRLGSVFGRYRLDAQLGRGGMGVVFHAFDLELQRPVAIKFLSPDLARDLAFRERFVRESRMAAAIEHPAIVPVHEAGTIGDALFIVMRYVPGQDLGRILRTEAPLDVGRVLAIVERVADALDAAHRHGLVHRDVKPANVLVERDGEERAYLTDFGLSRRAGDPSLTLTTGPLGTIDYIAPEQIQGTEVDGRADQYALACLVVHCLTGAPPFEAASGVAVLYAHVHQPPPRVRERRPDLPAALDGSITRALSKDPAARFPDCASFVSAMRAAVPTGGRRRPRLSLPRRFRTSAASAAASAGGSARAPRHRRWAAGLVGIVAVILLGSLVLPSVTTPDPPAIEDDPSPRPRRPARTTSPLELRPRELIVFASDRDGDYDLYALGYGDDQPRRLGRNTDRDERSPAISPDGTMVAYVVGEEYARDIWLIGIDGTRPRPLTLHPLDDTDPAWSSDGRRLAFASRRSDPLFDVWEIRTRGGRLDPTTARNLTGRTAVEHFPDWIPRSSDLLMASNQEGQNRDIWRIDAGDAASLGRLTSTYDFDFKPAVSPGGGAVAFYRRPFCATCLNDRGPADVMLMNIAGGNQRQLTQTPGRDELDPAWSPDGRAIAYTSGSFRPATGPVEDAELMVTTPDGRRRKRVRTGFDHVAEPSWSRVPKLPRQEPSGSVAPSPVP